MIEDFFGGYTFKYAKWNAATSSWDATQTKTIANNEATAINAKDLKNKYTK